MFLHSRVTIFLSLKETHHLVVKKTFDETTLLRDEDCTNTNCISKVQLWSCQGACELEAFLQPAEEDIQSLSLSVNSGTETDVQQRRYQGVPGSCETSFLSSCKRLSALNPSLCCKTSAICHISRLLAAKVRSLLLSIAVEGYCWQLFSTLLQPLLHHLPSY
jgi:hypothetical protein